MVSTIVHRLSVAGRTSGWVQEKQEDDSEGAGMLLLAVF